MKVEEPKGRGDQRHSGRQGGTPTESPHGCGAPEREQEVRQTIPKAPGGEHGMVDSKAQGDHRPIETRVVG